MHTDFIVGKTYFQLHYLDRGLEYPIIKSLVYIGQNLEENEDENLYFFQDLESYLEYGPYNGEGIDIPVDAENLERSMGEVYSFPIAQLVDILTSRELIERLQAWERRNLGKKSGRL